MKWPSTMTGTGGYLSGELRVTKEENVKLRLDNERLMQMVVDLLNEKKKDK